MTSNEVVGLGRPGRSSAHRGLRFFIAALTLSLAVLALTAMPVFAAATTSTTTSTTETGYSQKPKPPAEKKVAPAKEEKAAPKAETEPAKEVAPAPAVTPAPAKATALPFTGLDLRWVVGAGLLLIAMGALSLRVLGRRERHSS